MKKTRPSLKYVTLTALICAVVAAVVITSNPASSPSVTTSTTVTVLSAPTSTGTSAATTSTSTTVTTTTPTAGGLISVGPSRNQCLAPNVTGSGYAALQSAITSFDSITDTTVTCISSYLNGAPNWKAWVDPWITDSKYGYTTWVDQEPETRQLVLQVNLIPDSLENLKNPEKWELACADGHFNNYALELGNSLVAAGLGNSVIRLGAEMNGIWEADFIGKKLAEQELWAKCFANEVTGLRQAPGGHFLIDWNPNACKDNIPYMNFYPGNAYVDIVGLDLFDVGCETPKTPLSFTQLASEPAGLNKFEAFAAQQGKPMSFPEWGLEPFPSEDNPGYISGMGATVASQNFAFESYFDANLQIRPYLPLGTRTPLSLLEFQKWFAKGS